MLDRVVALASPAAAAARAAAAAKALAVRHASPQTMADATLVHYDAAVPDGASVSGKRHRFGNRRVRDALGYRPWHPSGAQSDVGESALVEPPAADVQPRGLMARVARRALAMRGTPMGRVLYRMTPAPVIDALKSRLDG
jgi:hypothetical protein